MKKSLLEIWTLRPLVAELVRRDLKLRYKNSIGGVAWSLLNPLMQIAVITVLMQFMLANPVKDYSAYLFVFFLWNFFQVCVMDGCHVILMNAQLVRKVYFPRAILPIVALLGNLFHFGIAFVFTILYFFYPVQTYPGNLRPEFLLVIPIVFFMSCLCLGLSFFLAYLNVFYEDVRFIVTAGLQLFFYGLPILYPIERVLARPPIYEIYMLNPVAAFLVTYQRALLPAPVVKDSAGHVMASVGVPWMHFGLACVVSVVVLLTGYYYFERNQWEMVERL
jgi:lipopolysaccharide transport system permease protein